MMVNLILDGEEAGFLAGLLFTYRSKESAYLSNRILGKIQVEVDKIELCRGIIEKLKLEAKGGNGKS